jgi:hypothetical protein
MVRRRLEEQTCLVLAGPVIERAGVAIPTETWAGLPNLHRIVIEFRKDICRRTVGKGRTMSTQIPQPIRAIALVFALLVSGLAVRVPAKTALAADCLTAPNSSAPPNSHWYYRTDRVQQRKCWYLRAANEAPQQTDAQTVQEASPNSLASFKNFLAQRGGAKMSDQDVERLYTEFLAWNRRARN